MLDKLSLDNFQVIHHDSIDRSVKKDFADSYLGHGFLCVMDHLYALTLFQATHFSFPHSVFKRPVPQTRKSNPRLFGKELIILTQITDKSVLISFFFGGGWGKSRPMII